MCGSLHLAPTGHPQVPDDIVNLTVDVDTSHCGTPISQTVQDVLAQYQQHGIQVPVSRIVAYSGIHYRGEAVDHWNIGSGRAEMQNAWQDINNRNPHCITDSQGNLRLLFDSSTNSRRQANFTETVGVGVGLFIATRFFNTPYRYWSPTPALSRYDYRAFPGSHMEFQLEARGRFAGNLGSAKSDVWDKFGQNANLSRQLAVIFCPRENLNSSHTDVILLDPTKNGAKNNTEYQNYRSILKHYCYFFARQNFHAFANRLYAIAQSNNDDFLAYLKVGDDKLRKSLAKRVTFEVSNYSFQGTAWKGFAWPFYLSRKLKQFDFSTGFFYWGIWNSVIEYLREGRIPELEEMITFEQIEVVGKRIYMVLDDATALAWAPTIKDLLEMP
jgi:hypothetical protein